MSKHYTNYNKPNEAKKQNEDHVAVADEIQQSTGEPTEPATPENNQVVDPAQEPATGEPTPPATPEDNEQTTSDPAQEYEPEVTEPIIGVVSNCKMLNVRADTNKKAEIITIIPAGTEVVVRLLDENDEWLEVHSIEGEPGVVGFHGFCMKDFITIK